jgi:hypothetical protein
LLTSVILATQEARSGGSQFETSPGKQLVRPYLKKSFTKIGLVEWLKVKALNSSYSTANNNNNNNSEIFHNSGVS